MRLAYPQGISPRSSASVDDPMPIPTFAKNRYIVCASQNELGEETKARPAIWAASTLHSRQDGEMHSWIENCRNFWARTDDRVTAHPPNPVDTGLDHCELKKAASPRVPTSAQF